MPLSCCDLKPLNWFGAIQLWWHWIDLISLNKLLNIVKMIMDLGSVLLLWFFFNDSLLLWCCCFGSWILYFELETCTWIILVPFNSVLIPQILMFPFPSTINSSTVPKQQQEFLVTSSNQSQYQKSKLKSNQNKNFKPSTGLILRQNYDLNSPLNITTSEFVLFKSCYLMSHELGDSFKCCC